MARSSRLYVLRFPSVFLKNRRALRARFSLSVCLFFFLFLFVFCFFFIFYLFIFVFMETFDVVSSSSKRMRLFRLEFLDVDGHLCYRCFEAHDWEDAYLWADNYLPAFCTPLNLSVLRRK